MKTLKKIAAYPLSIIYYFLFFLNLLIFHVVQWLSLKLGGYEAHKKSVDIFNFCILRCLNVLGTSFSFDNPYNIPSGVPCIFVANHQGTYDIPPLIWYLRKHHPKFVSKKELGKGIPSISFNLRYGGSVLIDRKNPRQAISALQQFALSLKETKHSAVIFPEGTRSRTGAPKKFQSQGIQMLFKKLPEALVVPITINNSWKLFRYGSFPLDIGVHLNFKVHEPIPVNSMEAEKLAAKVERIITTDII